MCALCSCFAGLILIALYKLLLNKRLSTFQMLKNLTIIPENMALTRFTYRRKVSGSVCFSFTLEVRKTRSGKQQTQHMEKKSCDSFYRPHKKTSFTMITNTQNIKPRVHQPNHFFKSPILQFYNKKQFCTKGKRFQRCHNSCIVTGCWRRNRGTVRTLLLKYKNEVKCVLFSWQIICYLLVVFTGSRAVERPG